MHGQVDLVGHELGMSFVDFIEIFHFTEEQDYFSKSRRLERFRMYTVRNHVWNQLSFHFNVCQWKCHNVGNVFWNVPC